MSQIISRGLGGGAEIPQLILLRGLSPASLPPPPTPGTGNEFATSLYGKVLKSFDSFSSLIFTDGIEFTLGPRANQITWQTIFGTTPVVVDIVIQISLDGLNWQNADETTNTSGEVRTFKTSAGFIRAAMLDMSEGIVTTVSISVKPMEWLG